jgi:CheY-like chemotaxis protein
MVEDDPEAVEFFRYVLVTRGRFQVTHTADPVTALAMAAAQCWDLLLTDLDLPGMSGLELLAALRPMTPRLPVILVTARPLDLSPIVAAGPDHPGGVSQGPVSAGPLSPAAVRPDALLAKPVKTELLLDTASRLAARLGPRRPAGS